MFMRLMTKSKKLAVSLTYISIIIQALSTMFLTSFYLRELGSDTYGLFQMINAVAQYILILDLGISTVMIRYISEFDARDNHQKSENFAFHFGIVVLLVLAGIVSIGIAVNLNIENIYPSLTSDEYDIAHNMFVFIIIQLAFTVVCHYFQGMSLAYEQYSFEKIVTIVQILLNTVLVVLFIKFGMGILGIVIANAAVIALHTVVSMLYSFFAVKFRIRFHGWELSILRPAGVLMIALLLQAIVGHVNGSVDKTILGIMTTKTDVAVYAVAATIITMFNTLPMAVSSVFQPEAVRLVTANSSGERLTSFVIRPGRIQFMLLGGFFGGFLLFGQDFIICWTNKEMLDAWKYVLIIMIPNAVPLVQNTTLSVLNALDKRIYRSVILVALTLVNIGLTVALIPVLGPIGAPVATSISYVIGHVILMNVYYQKKIGLNVPRMFKGFVDRTWICIAVSIIVNIPLVFWQVEGNWWVLLIKALAFCSVYIVLLVVFGFNSDEKQMMTSILTKLNFIKRLKRR